MCSPPEEKVLYHKEGRGDNSWVVSLAVVGRERVLTEDGASVIVVNLWFFA
jgi:hypothetical protein